MFPEEALDDLERQVKVLREELVNLLEIVYLTDDPETVHAAVGMALETLKA